MITPDFVGQTIAVHNGRQFVPVYVTGEHGRSQIREFSPTRSSFRGHAGAKNKGKKTRSKWSSKRNSRCQKEAIKSIVVKLNNRPTQSRKTRSGLVRGQKAESIQHIKI
jgi:hypothetical protein